uniref:Uncharacterized protein n=1 Tax=Oryza nivara TaxID=4536 RepID=A0A0E0J895_ORYNI
MEEEKRIQWREGGLLLFYNGLLIDGVMQGRAWTLKKDQEGILETGSKKEAGDSRVDGRFY